MNSRNILMAASLLAVTASTTLPAQAASPYGIWKRPSTGVLVRIFRCGGGLGVRVVKSSIPGRIGKIYMCGARKGRDGRFSGRFRNPEDNGTYAGYARLISARKMELSGCIPRTSLCRSEVWRRIR